MTQDELSQAVIVWTGWGTASLPTRDEELLVRAFGDKAVDLVPKVHALDRDFYQSKAYLTAPNLQIMGEQAASEFRAKHPEVAEDAVRALTWCYTFDYK